MGFFDRAITLLLIGIIQLYRWIVSPILGQHCRFYPTCSVYAMQAIKEYGVFYGVWLVVRRLLRCHPWDLGGIDEIPPKGSRSCVECNNRD